jgi:hypothetical protein
VGVAVALGVGEAVSVEVAVSVGVADGVGVSVGVGVGVGVELGTGVAVGTTGCTPQADKSRAHKRMNRMGLRFMGYLLPEEMGCEKIIAWKLLVAVEVKNP